jgi:elongation factor G
LYDGSYHDVDSSEIAFKIAAGMAFRSEMSNASPVLLEPVMEVVVITPDSYMGDVIGDINARRGKIMSTDTEAGKQKITAEVPLGGMFGYVSDLRSMTSGQAGYSMEFKRYQEVPKSVQAEICKPKST